MNAKTSIIRAIDILGGVVRTAEALQVRYQTVQQWVETGSVPPKYCPTIERLTGGQVRCEELRADVDWTYLRGTTRRRKPAKVAA